MTDETSQKERLALAATMAGLVDHPGWKWLEKHLRRSIESEFSKMANERLDEALATRTAFHMGMVKAFQTVMELPGGTISAVKAELDNSKSYTPYGA